MSDTREQERKNTTKKEKRPPREAMVSLPPLLWGGAFYRRIRTSKTKVTYRSAVKPPLSGVSARNIAVHTEG